MCGLIFHKEPSTGLHTLIALAFSFTLKNPKEIPHALDSWIGFMNGTSHYYLGGGVVQITTEPIWVILYGAYH